MKWLLLTTSTLLVIAPAYAKDVKRVNPERLYQEAKAQCEAQKPTNPDGWPAYRACISEAKGRILMERDKRVSSTCGKYAGDDQSQCIDWVYTRGSTNWSPKLNAEREQLRRSLGDRPLPPENPRVLQQGRQHQLEERENINRAMRNDPRSHQSTITGIGGHGGDIQQSTPSRAPTFSTPNVSGNGEGKAVGGVRMYGEPGGRPGELEDVENDVRNLMEKKR
jgi:hypothetical protein